MHMCIRMKLIESPFVSSRSPGLLDVSRDGTREIKCREDLLLFAEAPRKKTEDVYIFIYYYIYIYVQ